MDHQDRLTLVTTILTEYASGVDPLDAVAKQHGITGKTVREWAVEYEDVGSLYARARLISAGALEDAVIETANACTAETYQADNVKINSYKWAAAKRAPKDYGDTVKHEVGGSVQVLHLDALRAPRAIQASATVVPALLESGETVTSEDEK